MAGQSPCRCQPHHAHAKWAPAALRLDGPTEAYPYEMLRPECRLASRFGIDGPLPQASRDPTIRGPVSLAGCRKGIHRVHGLRLRHVILERDLMIARTRAAHCAPSSPSWAAAIELVEEVERQLWVLERMIGRPAVPEPPRDRALEPDLHPDLALVTAG
jgi:hypothetical protein